MKKYCHLYYFILCKVHYSCSIIAFLQVDEDQEADEVDSNELLVGDDDGAD